LVFSDAEPAASITIRSFAVKERTGEITHGLFTSDHSAYEALKGHIDTVFAGEALPEHRIVFDGTQRKRYTLEVAS
jgi:U3 small nucleolar ribonucleoprotein protein IMP4